MEAIIIIHLEIMLFSVQNVVETRVGDDAIVKNSIFVFPSTPVSTPRPPLARKSPPISVQRDNVPQLCHMGAQPTLFFIINDDDSSSTQFIPLQHHSHHHHNCIPTITDNQIIITNHANLSPHRIIISFKYIESNFANNFANNKKTKKHVHHSSPTG